MVDTIVQLFLLCGTGVITPVHAVFRTGVYMPDHKTAIITGASRGIGAGIVEAFLKQGYNVVATARSVSQQLTPSTSIVLIDGDIGRPETAAKVVEAAITNFG